MISGFQCCFCGKGIEETSDNPVDIKVVLNSDFKNETDSFQLFYAHFICLKTKLHKSVQGFFIGDDED